MAAQSKPETNPANAADRPDHLETHGRPVAILLTAAAIGLTAASFATDISDGLPSIALDWTFGLHVIRAAEIFAIVALVVMLIVRGWGGRWPSRVSTSGIDFADLAEGSKQISLAVSSILEILPELVRLEIESADNRRSQGGKP